MSSHAPGPDARRAARRARPARTDPPRRREPGPGERRRRQTHSLESILEATVGLLDEYGEGALTFRALAARLGTGVGSLYWYVAGKDELLDLATDSVVGTLVSDPAPTDGDPIENLRRMLTEFYDLIQAHPWAGNYLMRNVRLQPAAMLLYDRLGQQTMRLELTPRQQFHAVSALTSYVVGVGAEIGQAPEDLAGELDRDEFLSDFADQWRHLDPAAYPFVHHVADEFERHQDAEQFEAGLGLLLSGIAHQAERA